MTEKHTKEPWGQARKDIIAPPLDASLLKADPEGNVVLVARFEREEDAERAVICVNACIMPDGTPIPTEALKNGALSSALTAYTYVQGYLHKIVQPSSDLEDFQAALAKLKGESK